MEYKIIFLFCIILILFLLLNNYQVVNIYENYDNLDNSNHFKIIVTTYNPGIEFLKQCLKSIEIQTYKNYKVFIIDDASINERDEIRELLEYYKDKYDWNYIQKTINEGPCQTRDMAIHNSRPNDDDILVLVDGDDELYDENVLNKLNDYYSDKNLLLTFGNYVRKTKNGKVEKNKKIRKFNLEKIIRNNLFRESKFFYTHLKTFKYKLYKNINKDDLKKNGEYIRSSTDIAIMMPMLEMAGNNIKFTNEKMYKYTFDHEESFHTNEERKKKQLENAKYIKKKPKYQKIDFNKNTYFIFYINLDKRKDRRNKIVKELNKLELYNSNFNFNIQRLQAVEDKKFGGIGCGKSHIECLKKAKYLNLDNVIIIEDDIQIDINLVKKTFQTIENMGDYDVIILSGHGEKKYINNNISKAREIQTTGMYIIKKHYYDKLINNFEESVNNMERLKNNNLDINYEKWAIDQNWKKLQKKDNWFIVNNILGKQIPNYSDIEKDIVNYNNYYL